MHTASCFHVTVVQGIEVDIHDRTLFAVLLVVNPTDNWAEIMERHLVDEAVFAMEMDGLRIMLMEDVEGMNHWVVVAEEAIHSGLFFGRDVLEAMGSDVLVFLDETFGYINS